MSNRLLVALGFSVLLVFAGCSGGGTDAPTTEQTLNPSDSIAEQTTPSNSETSTVAETPTETSTATETAVSLSAVSYPSGANVDGISNGTALIAAHNDALVGLDFTGQYNGTSWEGTANRSGRYTEHLTLQVDADRRQALVSLVEFSNRQESTLRRESGSYGNRTVSVSRLVQNGEMEYRVRDVESFDQSIQFGTDLEEVFRVGSHEPVGAVRRGDRTLIRYELAAVNRSLRPENGTVDVAEGAVVVDERGLVHEASFRVRVTATEDGVSRSIERRVTFSLSLDEVAVERPPWVDTAISQQAAS